MNKQLTDCTLEEISDSSFNLYVYAVMVIKGRLPHPQHELMERLKEESPDEYVIGYFKFLSKKKGLWGRIKSLLGG